MAIFALLYIGSIVIILWGIGHLIPTKSIVKGFGELTDDNKKTITMEWIAEGLTLIFLGFLPLLATILAFGIEDNINNLVFYCSAGMLFILAGLSMFTGARTTIIPMKMCPIVKSSVAILYLLGVFL